MSRQLDSDGFELLPSLFGEQELTLLEGMLPSGEVVAGKRIFNNPQLERWLDRGALGDAVRDVLGAAARPVRAILFNKSGTANWALGWHQDRTIAVRQRIDTPGFEHWNKKTGVHHVEPPFPIIERMVTARIHLDAVDASNSPLLVARSSHRFGRIEERAIASVVERCGTFACLANRTDVWLYRTAILHASETSAKQNARRVLQIDFSAARLPAPLEWLGVG